MRAEYVVLVCSFESVVVVIVHPEWLLTTLQRMDWIDCQPIHDQPLQQTVFHVVLLPILPFALDARAYLFLPVLVSQTKIEQEDSAYPISMLNWTAAYVSAVNVAAAVERFLLLVFDVLISSVQFFLVLVFAVLVVVTLAVVAAVSSGLASADHESRFVSVFAPRKAISTYIL